MPKRSQPDEVRIMESLRNLPAAKREVVLNLALAEFGAKKRRSADVPQAGGDPDKPPVERARRKGKKKPANPSAAE